MSYRPKGETTHYILRVASAPSSSAVTDLLDFQVADAPLQIQFASAKCVRCAPLRSGAADWRSGPRRSILSVLCPVHPFATTWHFPSRGNERYGEKNRASYTSRTTPVCPPLVAGATTLPGGKHVTGFAGRLQLPYESSSFATSRGNEKIGGTGYCVTYDTESQSRNADFISIAAERQSTTLGPKGRQT